MKLYLIGFGKGLLLILVFAVLAYIGELQGLSDTASSLVAWIAALVIVLYLIREHKLLKAWVLLVFVLGVFALPFILGHVELKRPRKKAKR